MRNLKKLFAVVVVVAIMLTAMVPAFAAETTTAISPDAQSCVDLGMLTGDNGVTVAYTATQPARIQALVMLLRLKGVLADAQATSAKADNFSDVTAAWEKPLTAYAKAHPEIGFGGIGNNKFDPNTLIDAKQYYSIILTSLGYKAPDDYTWDTVATKAAAVGLKKLDGVTKVTIADIAAATVEALKTKIKDGSKTLAEDLVAKKVFTNDQAVKAGVIDGAVKVNSITANTAKSFLVKFNRAVKDEDKITFSVKRLTSEATVTTTWNTDKTEATLTSASNLPESAFTVSVLQDTKEIFKQDLTITAQKVAKIEFTSKSVSVKVDASAGYVTYKIYDQYNNDITNTYLANNITFQTGVTTTLSGKNGLLTLTPGATPLLQFPNITIVAYDTTSGISATVSLPTTTSAGTLSEFTLGSAENVKLNEGDVTSVFYLPYTAKDLSGNDTTDFDLVKGGLIFSTGTSLITSLPGYVSAQLVRDPADNRKAAIEVKAITNATGLAMDMPVTITAMTYAGKSSAVSTTLVKSKAVATITLLAPSETVAVGEKPEIGFEALDQFGNKITSYSQINNKVSPTGFTIVKKVDGSAKFVMNTATLGVMTLSAVVNGTGKMSTLNINVQAAAKPARIGLNPADIVSAMENTATQNIVIGDDDEIIVYDQYDRKMGDGSIATAFNGGAAYTISVDNTSADVGVGTPTFTAVGTETVTAAQPAGGSDTIVFDLNDVVAGKVLSTVSVPLSVIKTSDIVDYTISTFDKPIYASITAGSGTAQEQEYAANPSVYGKTNSGAKVLLAGSPVVSASVDNSTDFQVLAGSGAYDAVKVTANKLPITKTTADTGITVNLFHNGKVTALNTKVSSSSVAPVATNIETQGCSDDKYTVAVGAIASLNGYVAKYTETGATPGTTSPVWFKLTDSYGKNAMVPAHFYANVVTTTTGAASAHTCTINANTGAITASNAVAGESIFITAITNNGLVKVIEVDVQ